MPLIIVCQLELKISPVYFTGEKKRGFHSGKRSISKIFCYCSNTPGYVIASEAKQSASLPAIDNCVSIGTKNLSRVFYGEEKRGFHSGKRSMSKIFCYCSNIPGYVIASEAKQSTNLHVIVNFLVDCLPQGMLRERPMKNTSYPTLLTLLKIEHKITNFGALNGDQATV